MRPSDEPAEISHDEARQEFLGRGPSRAGMAAYEVILIVIAVTGSAIAFETIDHWSQWLVLGAIIFTLIGFIIALNPERRGA